MQWTETNGYRRYGTKNGRIAGATDWSREAEPYRRRIARHLADTLLPELEDEIVTSRVLTPLDFRDRLNSVAGAGFGIEPILTQSAWFRPHNRSEDVAGLYLVGAGTHPGAGLPGVVSSARVLDAVNMREAKVLVDVGTNFIGIEHGGVEQGGEFPGEGRFARARQTHDQDFSAHGGSYLKGRLALISRASCGRRPRE